MKTIPYPEESAIFAPDRTPPPEQPLPNRIMAQLAAKATADTPPNVEVPATIPGLTQYLLARWGPWGAILIFTGFLWVAYTNSVAQTQKVLQDRIESQSKQIESLHIVIQTMDRALKAAGQK